MFDFLVDPKDVRELGLTCKKSYTRLTKFEDKLRKAIEEKKRKKNLVYIPRHNSGGYRYSDIMRILNFHWIPVKDLSEEEKASLKNSLSEKEKALSKNSNDVLECESELIEETNNTLI